MVKIKKVYFFYFIIFILFVISIFDIIFENFYNYKLYLFYLILLSFVPYQVKDIQLNKKLFFSILYFILSVILISFAQYIFSFFNENIVIYGILLILLSSFLLFFYEKNFKEDTTIKIFPIFLEYILVGLIFFIAIFLRVYKLNEIPLGIWFDEAQNGNEVIRILENNEVPVFIPRFTQMPAMYFYLGAFMCKLFGIEILSLRLVSVIVGSLCCIAFYFLLKHIFKNSKYALFGSFLISTSRWHITFSRVAFLGMLSILIIVLCFYFYLKMLDEKRTGFAIVTGLAGGLGLYAFTTSYFLIIFIFLHNFFIFFKSPKNFIKNNLKLFLIFLFAFLIATMPLFVYSLTNYQDFTARAKDVSILNDIKNEKSFMPVIRNIYRYFLTFNFAGDYNGRHNLYKKPLLDEISAVLFVLGFLISIFKRKYRKFFFAFIIMLLPGILTINIEAPQAYRITGAIPFVYILVVIALFELEKVLLHLKGNAIFLNLFLFLIILSIGIMNFNQYFILYPQEKASYMDFSPEATGIGNFILKNSNDYYILVSKAQKMYGFYYWEQKQILSFMTYNKAKFDYMEDYNKITIDKLIEKKGVALIIRPSDTDYIERIEKEYPDSKKEEYKNYFNGEILYIVYYINSDKIKKSKNAEFIIYLP